METGSSTETVKAARTATIAHQFHEATSQPRTGPAALAFRDGAWRERGWDELREHVERVARGLIALGIEPGDRVSILSNTREEWTWCDYGALCAGACVVPIYQTNSPVECEFILHDAEVRLIVCEDAEQLAKVEAVRERLPQLTHVLTIDPSGDTMTLADVERLGREHADAHPDVYEQRWQAVGPDDLCTLIYTSGTTGSPKGCMVLHRNYHAMLDMVPGDIVETTDVAYLYLPLAHSFARLVQFAVVKDGATIAYSRGTKLIAEDLVEVRPTLLPSVPRVFEKVYHAVLAKVDEGPGVRRRIFEWALGVGRQVVHVRMEGREPGALLALQHRIADRLVYSTIRDRLGGRLRLSVSGGAPISPEILEFFHAIGIVVLEAYGLTETSTAAAIMPRDVIRFGSVGRPFPGMDVAIADDGEILLHGPNIFAGYWRNPAATSDALQDGWLHTGDVGTFEDGFLSITDRKKDIIITAGGKNVAPSYLENGLKESPFISEACVVGDRRPYLVCLITLAGEELEAWAEAHGIEARGPELRRHPQVRALVQREVDRVNALVATTTQIKRFGILDGEFSQETGELTPTLKLKRKLVLERHAATIDALYAGTGDAA
jgi:long-chain acyl-CoA synthetase